MPFFKTLTTLMITAGFAVGGVANAQETQLDPMTETDHFATADANADNALNKDEFMAYVNARADAGDDGYGAIRDGGNLETLFRIKDANEDGLLDRGELETS